MLNNVVVSTMHWCPQASSHWFVEFMMYISSQFCIQWLLLGIWNCPLFSICTMEVDELQLWPLLSHHRVLWKVIELDLER